MAFRQVHEDKKMSLKGKNPSQSCFLPCWMALAKVTKLLIGGNLSGLSMEFAILTAAAAEKRANAFKFEHKN